MKTTITAQEAADLTVADNDLIDDHHLLLAQDAPCLTCGETYPGSGVEHGIRFDTESGMYWNWDSAHRANWISEEE